MLAPRRRAAFTLVEMLVVICIILALAALAAAFIPRVNDSQKLTRAVDSFEQWLLTAKMRAKRDGLATGVRFVRAPNDPPGEVSTFAYVQQPDALSGGYPFQPQAGKPNPPDAYQYPLPAGNWYTGGLLLSAGGGMATFTGVDFWLGSPTAPLNPLVQPGDYLEINGGGVYRIAAATGPTTLQLSGSPYSQSLSITSPTTNYRIGRLPRLLLGEEPLTLPANFAAHFQQIPGSSSAVSGTNVAQSPNGYWEILFSPSGAVIGQNTGSGFVYVSLWDSAQDVPDINRVGIVGVRVSNGFIGAYQAAAGADPFFFVKTANESGM